MAPLQEEPAPDGCKVIHGKVTYVQPMYIPGHDARESQEEHPSTMLPFQFVVVYELNGARHVLINPGTKLVEPTDVRIVYMPHSDVLGRGILMKDIVEASVRADTTPPPHSWNITPMLENGRVEAEGIIKSLEHAIQVGSRRAD